MDLQKSAMGVARLMCAAQLDGATDTVLLDLAVAASDRLHADPKARSDDGALTIDAALLTKACSDAGLEAKCATLLELAQGEAAKKALRANTEEAVARGAYGSPTAFVVVGEASEAMFFGSDRMEQLAHHLSLPYAGARPPHAKL